LGFEDKISAHLKDGRTPDQTIGWIEENVAEEVRADPLFARKILRAILADAGLNRAKSGDAVRDVSDKMRLLRHFTKTNADAQLACLFEVQELWNKVNSPKGMIGPIFQTLWDAKAIGKTGFQAWSDSSADIPNKSEALFETNNFIMSLPDDDDAEGDEEYADTREDEASEE